MRALQCATFPSSYVSVITLVPIDYFYTHEFGSTPQAASYYRTPPPLI